MEEDIKLTQRDYWGGTQVAFWPYALLVVFGGVLGLDHLLLRSPWTALYKFLSFIIPFTFLVGFIGPLSIPISLFWYFYDIAQLGEWNLTKHFGIMTPMNHMGIGAGIFHVPDVTPADKTMPSPFIYLLYVVTSIAFVSLPINKLVLGDLGGAMYQFVLLLVWPIAFAWGVYDIYRIFCKRKDLFHKGQIRIPPATIPLLRLNPVSAQFYVDTYAKAGSIGPDGDYTYFGMGKDLAMTAADLAVKGVVKGVAGATDMLAKEANKLKCSVPLAASTSVAPSISVKPLAPVTPIKPVQQGGAILTNLAPAVSSPVLLFCVALLAFSGYVMYSFKKTYYKTTEDDDSPPDPSSVRGFTETRG